MINRYFSIHVLWGKRVRRKGFKASKFLSVKPGDLVCYEVCDPGSYLNIAIVVAREEKSVLFLGTGDDNNIFSKSFDGGAECWIHS